MPRQSLATRAARRPSDVTGIRNDAVIQMNDPLTRKFRMLETSVNDLQAQNLRYYHKIGKICEEIRQSPDKYVGLDGTPGLKLIERALSTQARVLRKAATFAKEYTDQQLEELIGLTNPETKFRLNWGHVSFLLTLSNHERRLKYAQEAVEKLWDPGALHEAIKKRTQRSGGHGRKHEMPKTISAQIRQIAKLCKQLLAKNDNVWDGAEQSVFTNILNMPAADMESEMVEQLELIAENMTQISDAMVKNVETIGRVVEHMNTTITERDNAAEAAVAAGGRRARRTVVINRSAAATVGS